MVVLLETYTIHFYTGDILNNRDFLKMLINSLVLDFKNGEDKHQPQIILKKSESDELFLITITNSHKFRIVPYESD